MNPIKILLVAGLLAGAAQAQPSRPDDFAYGASLTVSGDAPLYRARLPIKAYEQTAWPDLRDLRVFDASGEPVAYSLRTVPAPTADAGARIDLQSFTLVPDAKGQGQTLRLAGQGNALELSLSTHDDGVHQARYLLALPEQPPKVTELILSWPQGSSGIEAKADVEASNDLQNWTLLSSGQQLMELHNGTQTLLQNHIRLPGSPPAAWRYWRLTINGPLPTLSAAQAIRYVPPHASATIRLQAAGQRQQDGSALYHWEVTQEASALKIVPADPNSVIPLQLQTAANDGIWIPLPAVTARRLQGAGQEGTELILNPPREVRSLRLTASGVGFGSALPLVWIERPALEVVFNARGHGPFTLAWGSAASGDESLPLTQLISDPQAGGAAELPVAQVGNVRELGGRSRLAPDTSAQNKRRWQTLMVWAALALGALLLLGLSWRVVRELKTAN